MLIPVAERYKARVCFRSLTRVAGSNAAGGMDVCVVLYSKEQETKPGQTSTEKVERTKKMPGQSIWNFLWTKWHSDRVFSKYFCFSLSVSFHHCSILIFINTLILLVGQKDEAREPSTQRCSSGMRGTLDRKVPSVA